MLEEIGQPNVRYGFEGFAQNTSGGIQPWRKPPSLVGAQRRSRRLKAAGLQSRKLETSALV
jgi:hypothetical protein